MTTPIIAPASPATASALATIEGCWQRLAALPSPDLQALVAQNSPDRTRYLVGDVAGIRFDFTKTHLDPAALDIFTDLATLLDFPSRRTDLFAGRRVNYSENRAAEHLAERGCGNPQALARVQHHRHQMRRLFESVERGDFGDIRHLLHIGIGGSALGPDLLVDALGRPDAQGNPRLRYDWAVVSNVDGAALQSVFARYDPCKTLIILASKSFTTGETLLNADSVRCWLERGGVADPLGKFIALTANPQQARAWGVREDAIALFSETVGGRYSLWSAIALSAALALGWKSYVDLCAGAAAMDRHFQDSTGAANMPLLAAFVDRLYVNRLAAQTRAVFPYDERLRLLLPYIQQLEMESNGKSATSDGRALSRDSAAIVWGGVGTDAQHAVFQLLHQGTHALPTEFILTRCAGHGLSARHHKALLHNGIAQGAALLAGAPHSDRQRHLGGGRPSLCLLLDAVNAKSLGALLAFYEHRCFANAVLLGINPFDQFGVELGKVMAQTLAGAGAAGADSDVPHGVFDASTRALLAAAFDTD